MIAWYRAESRYRADLKRREDQDGELNSAESIELEIFGEKPNLEVSAASDEQEGEQATQVAKPRKPSLIGRSSVKITAGRLVQTDLSDMVELDYVPEQQWEEDDNYSEQVQEFLKQLEDAEQLGQIKVKEQPPQPPLNTANINWEGNAVSQTNRSRIKGFNDTRSIARGVSHPHLGPIHSQSAIFSGLNPNYSPRFAAKESLTPHSRHRNTLQRAIHDEDLVNEEYGLDKVLKFDGDEAEGISALAGDNTLKPEESREQFNLEQN